MRLKIIKLPEKYLENNRILFLRDNIFFYVWGSVLYYDVIFYIHKKYNNFQENQKFYFIICG